MRWAGTVLSQPPTSTTASIAWARGLSTVSVAVKLRSLGVGVRRAEEQRPGAAGQLVCRRPERRYPASASTRTFWPGLRDVVSSRDVCRLNAGGSYQG